MTLALALCLPVAPSTGATFAPSVDPQECLLSLSGPIEPGDVERFLSASKKVFTPKEEVGESTSSNRICLNSPGGSFLEGMRLARHFFEEGVGTLIRKDEVCASACALMFMMGRAVGPEVSFVNRKLHVDGVLGFHRPSLRLGAEEAFGSRDIETSYDMAVTSVVDFIVLANKTAPWSSKPMVLPDLVERIFATPGEEMFFIDTVQKAVRWDIELIGVEMPKTIDEERAYYACENALQWRVALQDEPLDFVGLNLIGHWAAAWSYRVGDGSRFSVSSRKAGYASAGCLVDFEDGALRICGHDEYTDTEIGRGTCDPEASDGFELVSKLTMWPPETRLVDLNLPWRSAEKRGTCKVFSPIGTVTDNEPCTVAAGFDYSDAGDVTVRRTFTWPSGSRTLISSSEGVSRINADDVAQSAYVQGEDVCYDNTRSGNRFCFTAD